MSKLESSHKKFLKLLIQHADEGEMSVFYRALLVEALAELEANLGNKDAALKALKRAQLLRLSSRAN